MRTSWKDFSFLLLQTYFECSKKKNSHKNIVNWLAAGTHTNGVLLSIDLYKHLVHLESRIAYPPRETDDHADTIEEEEELWNQYWMILIN